MSNDDWLKAGAAVWVLVLAGVAAVMSPWLLGAVLVGAGAGLVGARHRL